MKKEELEKENAELKCECRRCVYTDCPCILSDYGKDKNGICDHFKNVFDENAELKDINTHTLSQLNLDNGELIIENEKLKKENAELIHENARLVTVIDKSKSWGISPLNVLIINNLDAQLTKAKEIIRDFISVAIDYIDKEDKNYSYIVEAEQFLKDQEEEPCGQ